MRKLYFIFLSFLFLSCYHSEEYGFEKWKDGYIQFSISKDMPDNFKLMILECIQSLREKTYLQLVNCEEKYCTKKLNTLKIIYNNTSDNKIHMNFATIGYCFAPTLELHTGAKYYFRHEFMHVLGFIHEHQRIDRDLYVKVFWENMHKHDKKYFKCIKNNLIDLKKYPYDYDSILHYTEHYFSCNKEKTLESITDTKIHGNSGSNINEWDYSDIDIQKINDLYPGQDYISSPIIFTNK